MSATSNNPARMRWVKVRRALPELPIAKSSLPSTLLGRKSVTDCGLPYLKLRPSSFRLAYRRLAFLANSCCASRLKNPDSLAGASLGETSTMLPLRLRALCLPASLEKLIIIFSKEALGNKKSRLLGIFCFCDGSGFSRFFFKSAFFAAAFYHSLGAVS